MKTPKNFKDAYAVLHRHAETLRQQREPDIDAWSLQGRQESNLLSGA
jgi:hypothetical protein